VADRYEIRYTDEAVGDIRSLRAFDQQRTLDGIDRHLSFEPARTSRSRIKRMNQPFWSQFRLRVEDFRVYYDIDETNRSVAILRVLKKTSQPTLENPP
jgi:mRNA-degrading endonuclease RelE of RelBE toxin-antitoxin system